MQSTDTEREHTKKESTPERAKSRRGLNNRSRKESTHERAKSRGSLNNRSRKESTHKRAKSRGGLNNRSLPGRIISLDFERK